MNTFLDIKMVKVQMLKCLSNKQTIYHIVLKSTRYADKELRILSTCEKVHVSLIGL